MKILIASDIHGSIKYCKQLFSAAKREEVDKILLLGDLLYHGPRNDLPDEYAPKEVISLLNQHKDMIFAVRGNCDTEVDQMVLDFPILADYCIIPIKNRIMYATHGHIYNTKNLPNINRGDIILNGHTHVTAFECREDLYYFNPGSVSIPKENTQRGYILLEDSKFIWKTLEGNILKEILL